MTGQQLKNSILQMAVQGKLVPQDPNDEPASVLLERIRAEKEQLTKEGKIKKEKNPSIIFRGADNLPYEKIGKNEPVCIADEVPFEIPESWEWVRLGKIVYNRGQMKPIDDFCYIDIGSIDNKNQKLNDEEFIVTADKAPSRARKIVAIGDILYSTVRPYLHNMCIVNRSFSHQPIASTGFAALTCHTGFYNKFLFYYLMSPDFDAYANSTDNAKGVAYPAINDTKLYRALIPVPPEEEQKRIIKRLKKVLPYVDTYSITYSETESLNNAFPDRIKKSILQYAVQGKLVPQNPSDEPASILLERIRAEKQRLIAEGKIKKDKHESVIFRRDNSHYEKLDGIERCIDDEIPFDIPNNWVWTRLRSIASVLGGKRIPAGRHLTTENTGYVYIRVSDMKNGWVSTENLQYVPEDIFPSISKYIINAEDIFITVAGTIGRVGKIPPEIDGANLTENADRLVFSILDQDWLILELQSSLVQAQIIEATTKVGQPKLAIARIENLLIALPPLTEQRRIVEKQRELFNKITLI
jgi:type I restriction enzyme S subunit